MVSKNSIPTEKETCYHQYRADSICGSAELHKQYDIDADLAQWLTIQNNQTGEITQQLIATSRRDDGIKSRNRTEYERTAAEQKHVNAK